jgi:hypothetical protein
MVLSASTAEKFFCDSARADQKLRTLRWSVAKLQIA